MNTKELIGPEYVGGQWVITLASGEVLELRQGMEAPGRDFSGCDLRMMKLCGANLQGCTFAGANLAGADLSRARLHGARFLACDLVHTVFDRAMAPGAVFSLVPAHTHARFANATLTEATFTQTEEGCTYYFDFSGADLMGALFENLDIHDLKFHGANATGSQWNGVWIQDAEMTGTDFVVARFTDCRLEDTDFSGSRMDGVSMTNCILVDSDVIFNGTCLDRAVIDLCDFSKGEYHDALQAEGATFRGATIMRTKLVGASLGGADFTDARVVCCTFEGAAVEGTRWDRARVISSRFRGCEFRETTFDGAELRDCDFQDTTVNMGATTGAVFEGCDWGVPVPGVEEAA